MSDKRKIEGAWASAFSGRYDKIVPGLAQLSVEDDEHICQGMFNATQLREIANVCIELAQEIEHND